MQFTEAQVRQIQQMFDAGLEPIRCQLKDGAERMDHLTADINQLAAKQEFNNVKTEAMFDMFETAKKGLSVLGSIGGGIKWAAGIAASIATAYTLWRHK